MNFKNWINNSYETNVMKYRNELRWIVDTVKNYAEGNIFEQRHVDISITLLKDVPAPVLGKYPGIATEQDKAYFKTMLKPNYAEILRIEIRKVESLFAGKGR